MPDRNEGLVVLEDHKLDVKPSADTALFKLYAV